jgi:hypothetical protein
MSINTLRCVFGFAFGLVCAVTSVAEARGPAGRCANETLEGSYAFSFSGHLTGGAAFASIGVQTFDGEGSFEVTGTTSLDGFIIRPSVFHGTYVLNGDCSGSMVASYPDGSTGEADIVSTANGRHVYAILAGPGQVVTGTMTRQ